MHVHFKTILLSIVSTTGQGALALTNINFRNKCEVHRECKCPGRVLIVAVVKKNTTRSTARLSGSWPTLGAIVLAKPPHRTDTAYVRQYVDTVHRGLLAKMPNLRTGILGSWRLVAHNNIPLQIHIFRSVLNWQVKLLSISIR